MSIFARTTAQAVVNMRAGQLPEVAWDNAIRQMTSSASTIAKDCPRTAFLGLVFGGHIRGMANLKRPFFSRNAGYAVGALGVLHQQGLRPSTLSPLGLWRLLPNIPKHHNGQMEVVLTLWNNNDLL